MALMLILAGLAPPDSGTVRFDGADVYADGRRLVPSEIAVCSDRFAAGGGATLLEHVALPLRLVGATRAEANVGAHDALERAGVEHAAASHPRDVEPGTLVRVAIARAIVLRPRLLLANDLTASVDLIERAGLLALLRSLSSEQGMAVALMGAHLVPGPDRALEINSGRGGGAARPAEGPLADVFPLHRAQR